MTVLAEWEQEALAAIRQRVTELATEIEAILIELRDERGQGATTSWLQMTVGDCRAEASNWIRTPDEAEPDFDEVRWALSLLEEASKVVWVTHERGGHKIVRLT